LSPAKGTGGPQQRSAPCGFEEELCETGMDIRKRRGSSPTMTATRHEEH
jgi:hypothetical protein